MTPLMVCDQREQRVGRPYLRVSMDRSGRAKSMVQQNDDLGLDCESHRWRRGESYQDRAKSASRYSRDERDGFVALLDDLRRDRFDGSILLLWEASRGSRKVGEWVELIELCESREVEIWVHTHSRLYDPANPRDRRTLLEDAVDSEYESGKTSSRVRRDIAANAREGRPHGRCPYGFRRVFNPRTGRLENWEPDPQTAPHIAELFGRKNAGVPLREVARDWARRGIGNGSGKPFTDKDLRSMLSRPCYAGLRAHVPGSRGGGSRVVAESQLFPATWDAIVSVEDWRKAQRGRARR